MLRALVQLVPEGGCLANEQLAPAVSEPSDRESVLPAPAAAELSRCESVVPTVITTRSFAALREIGIRSSQPGLRLLDEPMHELLSAANGHRIIDATS